MITLNKITEKLYQVVQSEDDKFVGMFEKDIDGYFYFKNVGSLNSYALRAIADKLDEMNKDWDEQIKRDLI